MRLFLCIIIICKVIISVVVIVSSETQKLIKNPLALCQKWKENYDVKPGTTWGSLPWTFQAQWSAVGCDELLSGKLPNSQSNFAHQETPRNTSVHNEIIREIWRGENPINFVNAKGHDSGYPHTHIKSELIKVILQEIKPIFWLEAGSMLGGSAIATAKEIVSLQLSTSIVCLDPYTGDVNMLIWEKQPTVEVIVP